MAWEQAFRPRVSVSVESGKRLVVQFVNLPPSLQGYARFQIYVAGIPVSLIGIKFLDEQIEGGYSISSRRFKIPLLLLGDDFAHLNGNFNLLYDESVGVWVLASCERSDESVMGVDWTKLTLRRGRTPDPHPAVLFDQKRWTVIFNTATMLQVVGRKSHAHVFLDPAYPQRVGFRFQDSEAWGAHQLKHKSETQKTLVIGQHIWRTSVLRHITGRRRSFPLIKDDSSDVWYVEINEA